MTEHLDLRPEPSTQRPPIKLASYVDYENAQEAVDKLSDQGFPVATVSIVWSGLRRIEDVTGRRTVLSSAAEGAVSGAWFGTILGVLLALLTDGASNNLSDVGIVFTYFLVGSLGGGTWWAFGHWLGDGRRDFSSTVSMDAEAYELWVDPDFVGLASDILNIGTTRPLDPEPSAQ